MCIADRERQTASGAARAGLWRDVRASSPFSRPSCVPGPRRQALYVPPVDVPTLTRDRIAVANTPMVVVRSAPIPQPAIKGRLLGSMPTRRHRQRSPAGSAPDLIKLVIGYPETGRVRHGRVFIMARRASRATARCDDPVDATFLLRTGPPCAADRAEASSTAVCALPLTLPIAALHTSTWEKASWAPLFQRRDNFGPSCCPASRVPDVDNRDIRRAVSLCGRRLGGPCPMRISAGRRVCHPLFRRSFRCRSATWFPRCARAAPELR